MKSKFNLPITLLALAAVALAGCGPFGGGPAEKTVYVGPYQVDCVGVAPQKCLLIKEKAQDDWKMFYDQIQGFEYEAGYEYELLVREDKVDNPPADASSIRWTLIEIRSKTRSLEGTTWVLNSYLNSEGVLVSALSGSEATTRFQQEQVGGNASCNSYFGTYRLQDDRLTVDVGGMTEMYCAPEALMAQERDFLSTLDSAASYLIVENRLQIEDIDGKELLVFSALEPAPLVDTQWQLTGYNDGMGGFVSLLAGSEITALFAPDGRMGGSAGCNNYATTYDVAGDRISFGPVASTMMMCPDPGVMDQETTYLAALESVVAFSSEGRQLALMDAEGQVVLAYSVREPTPLVGTAWQMTFYNNGKGGFTSALLGTEVTAVFGEDGSLTGSAGCNRYTAGYQIDGDAISIGPAASTRMFCAEPEGTMEQEAAYLATLQPAATYAIQGDTLELWTAEGARLAAYVAKAEAAGLSDEALKNMEYKSEFTQSGVAPLTDGEYREHAAPGSATETIVKLTDHIARGQLSGQEAAAVILVTDPGGSGAFYDLAVVVEQDGQPVNVAITLLGDRAQINALSIENNEIVVDMITHRPEDPMCCPTQQVVQTYALQGDQLVQTSSSP